MNSESETVSPQRREVNYQSISDYLSDLKIVAGEDYLAIGNLTKGQIFKHLADSIQSSIDGFPADMQGPWMIRKIIGPLLKKKILHRKMKPGIRIPKRAAGYLPDRDQFKDQESLEELLMALQRYQDEGGGSEHPFIGKINREEWGLLHLRHAELHMSFLVKEG